MALLFESFDVGLITYQNYKYALFCNTFPSSFLTSSRIDPDLRKPLKIYPLPHTYVIKDLVPVSLNLMESPTLPIEVPGGGGGGGGIYLQCS